MEKLILDYSKWRCGADGENKLGDGDTSLLNDKGFMCCLGQWCRQLNKDITDKEISETAEPGEVMMDIRLLNDWDLDDSGDKYYLSSKLSENAMKINDAIETTPIQKIAKLADLLSQNNLELEVINKP